MYCQMFPELVPIPPKYPALMELIDQFAKNISQMVIKDGIPSMTVNVIYDQDILWTQGYGLKDITNATSQPDGDTMYLIGSNTKLFTALLGFIGQDKGLFALSDQVSSYVPEFSPINPFNSARDITFAQLASHMSGLSRAGPCRSDQGECDYNNQQMWPKYQNTTLINPPGSIPQYSNAGYSVLGHAIETVWKQDWSDLLQQEVFNPLGMYNTGTSFDVQFLEGRALSYTVNNTVANLTNIGWEAPSGSMYSTANDMAKFLSFFFRDDIAYMSRPDQILDGMTIKEWRQPRYILYIDSYGFGMPWEIYSSPIIYTKKGLLSSYVSYVVTVPQLKLGTVIMQSTDAVFTATDVFEMWASNFIQPFAQILQSLAPAPFIPDYFSNYIGSYSIEGTRMFSAIEISLVQSGNYSMPMITFDGLSLGLKYISDNVFKASVQGIPLSCEVAESGKESYIFFSPSSPPSFTAPGVIPGAVLVKN